ncbi:MAG: pyrroloquinoline quinone-dependent dehydrogenase [Lysobacterales bacterium]
MFASHGSRPPRRPAPSSRWWYSIWLLAAATLAQEWPAYGGNAEGTRHSAAALVTPTNVGELEEAWRFRTGELGDGFANQENLTFEATPILVGDTLYFSTAFGKAFAIDARNGKQRWRYDARIDPALDYAETASRGVSYWRDASAAKNSPCAARIFYGTLDARLIALDAATGKLCETFGDNGAINLRKGVRSVEPGEYTITSPPALVGDTLVSGSAIGDNGATNLELGVVRGFDARTGAQRWAWDPMPRTAVVPKEAANPNFGEIDEQRAQWTGGANAWTVLSADIERDLVFVPTGTASPDFFGGQRPGDNRFANSLVALKASTGRIVWARQLVHHDLWDYDIASQPLLIDLKRDGRTIPAVVQTTKHGQVFVLHRETGAALYAIHERAVPKSDVAGEYASPTQPFSALPSLVPNGPVTEDDAWGFTAWDRNSCKEKIRALRSEGIFTPPSLHGTIMRPGYAGGSNWGSAAFDPVRQRLIFNVNDLPMVVALLPRDQYEAQRDSEEFEDFDFSRQRGTPYAMRRGLLASKLGVPCTKPPWGKLVALDLTDARGNIAWSKPLGTTRDLAPWPLWNIRGVPNVGGSITTASGLIFIGATTDNFLRAFRTDNGAEVWKARLPAGGQATPMTYVRGGRQYVVIAAGGHGGMETTPGDYVIAYALPLPANHE